MHKTSYMLRTAAQRIRLKLSVYLCCALSDNFGDEATASIRNHIQSKLDGHISYMFYLKRQGLINLEELESGEVMKEFRCHWAERMAEEFEAAGD